MSINSDALPSRTRPTIPGRVLSFLRTAAAWVWRLGDRTRPVSVLAVAASAMLLVQLGRTIHDVDIFWQLKLGELTLTNGLPKTEPFLAGKEHDPLTAVAWLAQVVYAATKQVGGWTLLWLVDALVWFGGFAVVATACGRNARNVWPATVGLWVGWLAAVPSASVRPQSFAALAFGLLVVLMRSNLGVRCTAILGGTLFVAWQNLHPSVAVGGGVVFATVLAEAVMFWRSRRPTFPWRLVVLLPLAGLSTLATPAGFDIYRISAVNADVSRYLDVAEWLPLTWEPLQYGRPFAWGALFATIVSIAIRGRNLRAGTLAVFLTLTAAMLLSHRFVLFWGIAVIPVWVELLSPASDLPPEQGRSRWRRPFAVLFVIVGIGYPTCSHPVPFANYYPFAGLCALRESGVRGTVYTSYCWGGLVSEAGYPNWRVTRDGRYYLFSRREWDEYFAEVSDATSLGPILAKHQPAAFFLRPSFEDRLISLLAADPHWRELYADDNCVVYVLASIR
ncbi:hypothetical protein [Limnoglobus roseus]|uniref:Glycosyltransferase RgtA/B/C/D-like domain-containing protein n=1 Tax=Limnoglobus roseus TaxID=2598579 RepID=A0A5C1AS17_9BACT|nr:hypothetical protein [Limnoglobus roseus]QEL20024.1 hypothetical protein PX52LOC_07110 [Limnoglobus roseus]